MWKCKICGCQNPDTCTACRMCKAAAPYNTAAHDTAQNNTSQRNATREGASKFCGRCGRPIEQGLTSCRYCASSGSAAHANPESTPKNKPLILVMIAAAFVVLVLMVVLLQTSKGGIGLQTVQAQTTQQGTADGVPTQEPSVQSTPAAQETPSEIPEQQPSATVPNGSMSPRTKSLYYAYFEKYYGWNKKLEAPIYDNETNIYNVYFADLTHDGEAEMLVLDNSYGMESIGLMVYTCQNDSVVAICGQESYIDPKGCAFGIYTSEGESYLLFCCYGEPFFSKMYDYYYLAMSLVPDGEPFVLMEGHLPGPYSETGELPEGYYDLVDEMDQIKRESYMLFDPRDSYIRQSDPATVLG